MRRCEIIAGDKHGQMIVPGDTVIHRKKRCTVEVIYEEHDEIYITINDGKRDKIVGEEDIELV